MSVFEQFARTCGENAVLGLPNLPSIRFGLNHMHNLGNVMTEQRAKTEQFRFLLRSWYNTANVDS